MGTVTKLLIYTNDKKDADTIVQTLDQPGGKLDCRKVYDYSAFCTVLEKEVFNILFFDYNINDSTADDILSKVQMLGLDIPVIAIIENINAHDAFNLAKKGCRNYVVKGDYSRLLKVTEHELNLHRMKAYGNYTWEDLYAAISSIADGVIGVSKDGLIKFINRSAQKLTGWDEFEAIHKPLDTVFHIINAKTREKEECLKNQEKRSFNDNPILITRAGTEKWVSCNVASIKNKQGIITGTMIAFRDVSDYCLIEEEVKTEKNNLRMLFQYAPVGMVIVDEDCIVQDVNDHYLDMFGNQQRQVIGVKLGDSLGCVEILDNHSDGNEICEKCSVKEAVVKVIQSRLPFRDVEKRYRLNHNGSTVERNLKFNLVPIHLYGKTLALVSVDDMTEIRNMEENLRKSRDFYLTLFDASPTVYWRSDSECRTNFINKKGLEFIGESRHQDYWQWWIENIHPEDLRMCMDQFNRGIETMEPFKHECRIRRFDGEYRWIANHVAPFCDLEGNFSGFIGTCLDITEQKQAEELLKKYELLSETASDSILFIDMQGRIIEANAAAVKTYGYSRAELLSKKIFDLRKDREFSKKQVKKAFETGIFFESIHYRKDGTPLPVEVSAQSTILDGRNVVVSIIRDISERKQAELEMKRAMEATKAAYKAKSEFLANMSHEIRTPLNGIVGMLDLTMLTDLSFDQMDNLTTAKNCANNLLKIINDVLDFSKMEAGKLTIDHVEFDLRGLIGKIAKTHYYTAQEKGIELTYQIPADLPSYLIGDPYRLQQVLNNLIGNAVKFTDRGCVSLVVKTLDYTNAHIVLQFSVIDTGIGIAEEEMDKLFKSFSQIDSSRTRRFGGTGLGLVISKQLIELMGGILKVKSKKDAGSNFSFSITLDYRKPVTDVAETLVRKSIGKTKRDAKILLVEDDSVNQVVISRMLKEMGYSFGMAKNGSEALDLIKQRHFDLCLMDIQMPGMDGVQTTGIIRDLEQKEGKPHIPIVAITAHALNGDRERLLSMGIDEYISKPFQMSELFLVIEKLLEKDEAKPCLPPDSNDRYTNSINTVKSYMHHYVREIKPVLEEISNKMDSLRQAARKGTLEELEEAAHSIKTLASLISADDVKTLAFRIELAVRRGNDSDAKRLCDELIAVFGKYTRSICRTEGEQ